MWINLNNDYNLLIEQFGQRVGGMRPFDNRVLLLIGADLRAEILDHCVGRHPEGVCHVIKVRDVGLDSVES